MTPSPQSNPGQKKPFPVVLVAVIVGLALCPCGIGCVAAIAIPNFIKFQARANQSECKMNLKRAYVEARAYYVEKDVYETDAKKLSFALTGNRYVYAFAPQGKNAVISAARHGTGQTLTTADALDAMRTIVDLGVTGECPGCEITIGCAANLDQDSDLDIWSISSKERMIGGRTVPIGQLYNHSDDTK